MNARYELSIKKFAFEKVRRIGALSEPTVQYPMRTVNYALKNKGFFPYIMSTSLFARLFRVCKGL